MHRTLTAGLAMVAAAGAAHAQTYAHQNTPIEMGDLRQMNAWTVGALTRADGALPESLWANSAPASLGALFDRLPATMEGPAALALARRALASAGEAPRGEVDAAAARKRFAALGRLGFADDISVMASGASLADPELAQFAAQAELARGRIDDACQRARLASGAAPPPFLLRLRAYCAAVGGEAAAADLALEIARSANAEDAWFRSAINALVNPPPRRPAARFDTSLNASLSLAAGLPPGANPLANASTLALGAVARAESAPPVLRAQAAALAFRRGALTPAAAKEILLAAATGQEAGLPPIALTLRQIQAAPVSLEAAAAIAALLRQARAYADFAAAARLLRDEIAAQQAAPDAASALLFARAAAAAGDLPLAQRLAESAALAGADAAALAPVQTAIALSGRQTAQSAAALVQRRIDLAGAEAPALRAASRDVAILAASGAALDPSARAHLIAHPPQGGARPDAGVLAALRAAAGAGAAAETALLAALAGAEGAHALEAGALSDIIAALHAVDLTDAARAFAVEALIAGAPSAN